MKLLAHALRGPVWISAVFGAVLVSVRCSETAQPPVSVTQVDSADQIMFGMRVNVTHEGVRQAQIEADTAYQYEGRQVTELRGVTVHFYSSTGVRTSTLTADEGTFWWRSEDMEARGHVFSVTPDNRRLTTEILRYRKVDNQLVGDRPFVYVDGDQRLEGESFTSDPDFRNVRSRRPRGQLGELELN